MLWYKLIRIGLSTKMLKLLMAIYDRVDLFLKYNGHIGDVINSSIGLKQGCPLSSILFSIFTNDIVKELSNNLSLEERTKLFCLLFADDMVLFPNSRQMMTKLITNLENYTKRWELNVNLDKTKLILFRKERTDVTEAMIDFKYNGMVIEYVDSYKYLGINFQYDRSWNLHIKTAKTTGLKATFALKEKLKDWNYLPAKDNTDIFKSCVQSALLYGCELWSFSNITTTKM